MLRAERRTLRCVVGVGGVKVQRRLGNSWWITIGFRSASTAGGLSGTEHAVYFVCLELSVAVKGSLKPMKFLLSTICEKK